MKLGLDNISFSKIAESNIMNMVQSIIGHLPPEFAEQLGPMLEDMIAQILEENPSISMDELIDELDYRLESLIDQGPSEQEMTKMREEDSNLTEDPSKLWDELWPGTR